MPTVLILLSATTAGILDFRWQRIPNWLVLATLATSLTWHTAVNGLNGLWMSVAGLLLGTAILFPLFVVRGMGAGDVKLFGALGAAVTFKNVLTLFVISALIAGVMALVRALWARALIVTVVNALGMVDRMVRRPLRPHPVLSIDNPNALTIPFGVSVALATWVFVFFGKL
ncbi:MAG: A24 family peptidase [Blastocatellia bacterium]